MQLTNRANKPPKVGDTRTLPIHEQLEAEKSVLENQGPVKNRYRAERILLLLLYHPPCEYIHRMEDGAVVLKVSGLVATLGYKSYIIHDQLRYLFANNYLEILDSAIGRGLVLAKPRKPLVRWAE